MFQVYYYGQKQFSPEIRPEQKEGRVVHRVVFSDMANVLDTRPQIQSHGHISRIETSKEFTLMLDNNGQLWGYGFHKQGQLGYSKEQRDFKFQQEVTQIEFKEDQIEISQFEDIQVGASYAIGQTHDKIYAWGNTSTLLGHQEQDDSLKVFYLKQEQLHLMKSKRQQKKQELERVFVESPYKRRQKMIKIEMAMDQEKFLLTNQVDIKITPNSRAYIKDDEVYMGQDYSQESRDCNQEFIKIKELGGISVVNLSLGHDHMLAVTQEGFVWGYGSNQQGQLAISDSSNFISRVKKPVLLSNLQDHRIIQVATGDQCSFFLTYKGQLYSSGQTSHINKAPMLTNPEQRSNYKKQKEILFNLAPRLLDTGSSKVIKVKSGGNQHGALTMDGSLYIWGYGEQGSTLQENTKQDFQLYPQEAQQLKGLQVLEFGMRDGYTLVSAIERVVDEVPPPSAGLRGSMNSFKSHKSRRSQKKSALKLRMTTHIQEFREQAQYIYQLVNRPCVNVMTLQETIEQVEFFNRDAAENESDSIKEGKRQRRSQSTGASTTYQMENLLQSIVKDVPKQNKQKIINTNQFKNKSQLLLKQIDKKYHKYFNSIFVNGEDQPQPMMPSISQLSEPFSNAEPALPYQDEKQQRLENYLNDLIQTESQGQKYSYVQLIKQKKQQDIFKYIFTEPEFKEFIFNSIREDSKYIHYEMKLNKIMNKNDFDKADKQKVETKKIQSILSSFIQDSRVLPRLHDAPSESRTTRIVARSQSIQASAVKAPISKEGNKIGQFVQNIDELQQEERFELYREMIRNKKKLSQIDTAPDFQRINIDRASIQSMTMKKDANEKRKCILLNKGRIEMEQLKYKNSQRSAIRHMSIKNERTTRSCCQSILAFLSAYRVIAMFHQITTHICTHKLILLKKKMAVRKIIKCYILYTIRNKMRSIQVHHSKALTNFFVRNKKRINQKRSSKNKNVAMLLSRSIVQTNRRVIAMRLLSYLSAVRQIQRFCRWLVYKKQQIIIKLAIQFDEHLIKACKYANTNNMAVYLEEMGSLPACLSFEEYHYPKRFSLQVQRQKAQVIKVQQQPHPHSYLERTLLPYSTNLALTEKPTGPNIKLHLPKNLKVSIDSQFRQFNIQYFVSLELDIKYQILNRIYRDKITKLRIKRFKVYQQALTVFLEENKKQVDLERVKMMLKTGVKQLEEMNKKQLEEKNYDPFKQKMNFKGEIDHLPFKDKCYKIALTLKDAPVLQPVDYTMTYNDFKNDLLSRYCSKYKEKSKQLILSLRRKSIFVKGGI